MTSFISDQTKQTVGCLDVAGIHLVECDPYEEDPQSCSSLFCDDTVSDLLHIRTKYTDWNCKPAARMLRNKTWEESKSCRRQEGVDDNILKHRRHRKHRVGTIQHVMPHICSHSVWIIEVKGGWVAKETRTQREAISVSKKRKGWKDERLEVTLRRRRQCVSVCVCVK